MRGLKTVLEEMPPGVEKVMGGPRSKEVLAPVVHELQALAETGMGENPGTQGWAVFGAIQGYHCRDSEVRLLKAQIEGNEKLLAAYRRRLGDGEK